MMFVVNFICSNKNKKGRGRTSVTKLFVFNGLMAYRLFFIPVPSNLVLEFAEDSYFCRFGCCRLLC